MLHVRDFYEYFLAGAPGSLDDILHQPIYVSESMPANAVLNSFKSQKQYIGIVIDEFGSIEGIITLHDILESIVGYLPDLDEADETEIVRRDDASLPKNGNVPIRELNKELKTKLIPETSDNYATLAGFIIEYLSRFPTVGETLEYNGYVLEGVDMDGVRIDKVILTKKISCADN